MENTTADTALYFSTIQLLPLGLFCFLVTLFGLLGNGTVIYSSVRYRSIRLDRVSLILIRNLALADILYTLCVVVPQLVTYVARKWVLGRVYCVVMAQLGIIPVSANTLTVLAITSYRLKVVLNPLSVNSEQQAKVGVGVIWVLALVPTLVAASYKSRSEFHPENGRCLVDIYDNDKARIPVMMCVGVMVILPLFAITIFNMILSGIAIKYSRKKERRFNYRSLIMVCSLSGLFIVSWTPYVIFTFSKMKVSTVSSVLDLLAFHCIFINSASNPVLYTVVNKRFGEYVTELLMRRICFNKVGVAGV
ncbi:hypothetical protein ACHWQZ_G019173 [Mnemiopsis leidyi]